MCPKNAPAPRRPLQSRSISETLPPLFAARLNGSSGRDFPFLTADNEWFHGDVVREVLIRMAHCTASSNHAMASGGGPLHRIHGLQGIRSVRFSGTQRSYVPRLAAIGHVPWRFCSLGLPSARGQGKRIKIPPKQPEPKRHVTQKLASAGMIFHAMAPVWKSIMGVSGPFEENRRRGGPILAVRVGVCVPFAPLAPLALMDRRILMRLPCCEPLPSNSPPHAKTQRRQEILSAFLLHSCNSSNS